MRAAMGWIVGVIITFLVGLGLTFLGDALGVSVSVDLDGPTVITNGSGRYSYDEEVTSLMTFYGYTSGTFAFLIGLWAGQAAFAMRWGAGFTRKGVYSFSAWFIALSILMIVSVLTHLAFRPFFGVLASYARMGVELGAIIGVGWACHQWFKNRLKTLELVSRPD
jgi:hypothetical protein